MRGACLMVALLALISLCGARSSGAQDQPLDPAVDRAMRTAEAGNIDQAIADLNALAVQRPGAAGKYAYLCLGLLHYRARHNDAAAAAFSASVAADQNNPMAYYFLGMIHEAQAVAAADRAAARAMKSAACDAWRSYLATVDNVPADRPRHMGATRGENKLRAQRHLRMLTEDLARE